jgi:hypothetical protein
MLSRMASRGSSLVYFDTWPQELHRTRISFSEVSRKVPKVEVLWSGTFTTSVGDRAAPPQPLRQFSEAFDDDGEYGKNSYDYGGTGKFQDVHWMISCFWGISRRWLGEVICTGRLCRGAGG